MREPTPRAPWPREAGAAKLPRRVDTFLRLAMHQRAVRLLPKRARWAIRRTVAGPPVRRHVDRCRGVTFVGVTGSLGKTTTKDLIAAALATEGPTMKTRWTSNGLDGLPATLLEVRPDDRFAVIEAGIWGQPGEMRWLASLFEPTVAVLTMVTNDHVVTYGTVERVAWEKRALLERVPADGTVVVDADDPLCRSLAEGLRANVVRTGTRQAADVRLVDARLAWPHGLDVALDAFGERLAARVGLHATHLARLVPLTVAAAAACGVAPARTLAAIGEFEPEDGRMNPVPGPNGSMILADDYKSRPTNARAAIKALGETPGERRVAVLGEVEQEPQNLETYRELAELVRTRADLLVTVGRCGDPYRALLAGSALGRSQISLERVSEVAELLEEELRSGDVALLHGSFAQHLERARLRLKGEDVRCDVRGCALRSACADCAFVATDGPPARFVLAT